MNRSYCIPVVSLLIVFALVAVGCTQQQPPPPPDTRADDEAAIRRSSAEALEAAKARDFDKLASFYTEDAVAMFPGAPAVTGREQIKQLWQQGADQGSAVTWTVTGVQVAQSGDVAVETGTYQDTITGARGATQTKTGHYVVVLRKQADGSWKITHDIGHEEPAAPPAPAKKAM